MLRGGGGCHRSLHTIFQPSHARVANADNIGRPRQRPLNHAPALGTLDLVIALS